MKKLLFIALSLLSVGSVMCDANQYEWAADAGMDFEFDDAAGIDAPLSQGLVGPTVRAANDVVAGVSVGTLGSIL